MNIFKAVQLADDAAGGEPVSRGLLVQACAALVKAYRSLLLDVEPASAVEPEKPTVPEGRWAGGYFIAAAPPPTDLPFRIEKAGGETYILPR